MGGAKVISSDSHIVEPGDLWTTYITPKFRDRAPRLAYHPDTGDTWEIEGLKLPNIGRMGSAGTRTEDVPSQPRFDKDVRRGGWEVKARLEDMAVDGVDAQLLYPTVGFHLYGLEDVELLYACFEAWNSWIADWCKEAPERFRGIGFLCLDDIERGIQELERCKEIGLPGVNISIQPEDPPYSSNFYDPFWAAAQEMGMPVSMHTASNRGASSFARRELQSMGGSSQSLGSQGAASPQAQQVISDMILTGVFDRFPELTIIPAEFEAGWAAYLINRLDDRFHNNRGSASFQFFKRMELKPSEYFHRNFLLTFIDDAVAVYCRDLIGVDELMWSDDYPHIDGPWPESKEVHERIFPKGEVSEEDKGKILGGNAARVYDCFQ